MTMTISTRAVIARVQQNGTCYLGGTTWKEKAAMRLSVSNWSTSEEDIAMSADAIIRAARSYSERNCLSVLCASE
jgi:hypothetical protein